VETGRTVSAQFITAERSDEEELAACNGNPSISIIGVV
jgi:hypothetical protein